MPTRLRANQSDFSAAFSRFLAARDEGAHEVDGVVRDIIARVRSEGDSAVLAYTKQFDRFDATLANIRVNPREIAEALSLCAPELMRSLKIAAARIRDYSQKQLPIDLDYVDEKGVRLGHRWSAIDAVGLYVPGGTAFYPSSVLMNAVPAKVAGVTRLVMVVPSPEGKLNPALLAAAHVAGIDEIYKIGGAQAVAALAYGTATIAPVDKIVGPGNAYVAEAKRQVYGTVGIDMIAGPSEILVLADKYNDPAWIAADLLSQAEHDALAQSILVTDDAGFADAVAAAVEKILLTLPRQDIARASWEQHGGIIVVENWEQACAIANEVAPEHLELAVAEPEALMPLIRHAGAIFLGRHTPEAVGDYVAGPSHVLPTSRTARFSSGLSVFDFLKRTSLIGCTAQSLATLSDYVEVLATTEGLHAHALFRHRSPVMSSERILRITLDGGSIRPRSPEVANERNVAMADLLDENLFEPTCMTDGPYDLRLSVEENRLILDIQGMKEESKKRVVLSMQPLKRLIRDYFMICESYYEALKTAGAGKIEAIDMGRRGIHNEGAEILQSVLKDRIVVDFATSRRLFTLICVLHIK